MMCLNLAVSYMTARNGLTPGVLPELQLVSRMGGSPGRIFSGSRKLLPIREM